MLMIIQGTKNQKQWVSWKLLNTLIWAPNHFPALTTSERHFPMLPLEGRNIPCFHRQPFSSLPQTHMLKKTLARPCLQETFFYTYGLQLVFYSVYQQLNFFKIMLLFLKKKNMTTTIFPNLQTYPSVSCSTAISPRAPLLAVCATLQCPLSSLNTFSIGNKYIGSTYVCAEWQVNIPTASSGVSKNILKGLQCWSGELRLLASVSKLVKTIIKSRISRHRNKFDMFSSTKEKGTH